MKTGTKIKFRHDGQNKVAYITRKGEDSFVFTSTVRNGRKILTHIEEDVKLKYLLNQGITLPKEF